jgi:TonB family protein
MLTQTKAALMALLFSFLPQIASTQQNTTSGQKPRSPETIAIPSSFAESLLVKKDAPACPPAVRTGHLSGNVVVQVTITETGTVENLSVRSGPPSLRQAALDAVKTYRYRPYQLHHKPVPVLTTVKVVFNSQRISNLGFWSFGRCR